MKQEVYRVVPTSDFDLAGEDHQNAVNLLLDCVGLWAEVRDLPTTYDAEKARCWKALQKTGLFIQRITTDRVSHPSLKETVKVDIRKIKEIIFEHLLYFSPQTQQKAFEIMERRLADY